MLEKTREQSVYTHEQLVKQMETNAKALKNIFILYVDNSYSSYLWCTYHQY